MWLQQDGVPPHYARIIRDLMKECPSRSPDLTSPDFYLWGYLKNTVYRNRPTTRADMIQRITQICLSIPRQVLLNTIRNFERRIECCQQVNGETFEHLLQ